MAFKSSSPSEIIPDSPDKMLLSLQRRKIPGVLFHQGQIMQAYAQLDTDESDVALQLPTGSGKTLVGLMIAEWRRRKFNERVVYLCPTKQLVNQVVEQANLQYGLTLHGFTGRKVDYEKKARAEYQSATRIAVTTYNSLFNSNPFFSKPDIIIIDDAHAAENYLGNMWNVQIQRTDQNHRSLFTAISSVLKPYLDAHDFAMLIGRWDDNSSNSSWVDKLPTPIFHEVMKELIDVIDTHVEQTDMKWAWRMIRSNLHACHFYISATEFLIRPLIAPTWQHAPYHNAKQRIFMSATLGEGGDLERLTGRHVIKRLNVKEDSGNQGIGRRFFIFPDNSLDEENALTLRHQLMTSAGRSLVLVPSDRQADNIKKDIEESLGFETFSANDIEVSKSRFIESAQAVAIIANRYDGIDFPGEHCRLLFIEGLPRAANLQERFIMSKMGAAQLYNDRVQTRIIQAIGRCTRSMEDYSAVVVSGEGLSGYLADRRQRVHLSPELQAEIEFGSEQSVDVEISDIVENFEIFIANDERWDIANNNILLKRESASQLSFPALDELQEAVEKEIEYQKNLWQGDYEAAVGKAEAVLGKINHSELKGYRALWHYLAGSAAWLGKQAGVDALEPKALAHYQRAKGAAESVPWLVKLTRQQFAESAPVTHSTCLLHQIERVERVFDKLGSLNDRKFIINEKKIIDGLNSEKQFEQAHVLLGEMLGFISQKVETDASPDPWWTADHLYFVFEDHAGARSDVLYATKARQVASHPNWIKFNTDADENSQILSVLVTSVTKAKQGAIPHLDTVRLWEINDFREWALQALRTLRELKTTFTQSGNLNWRETAIKRFKQDRLSAESIYAYLENRRAIDILEEVP